MTKHLIIELLSGMLLLANVGGCGDPGDPVAVPGPPMGNGRIALTWLWNDAPLTTAQCSQLGVEYMQVDLESPDGDVQEYTKVTCALDRYSLDGAPVGLVQAVVTGLAQDGPALCAHLQGRTLLTAGTAYPDTPSRIVLGPASACISQQ